MKGPHGHTASNVSLKVRLHSRVCLTWRKKEQSKQNLQIALMSNYLSCCSLLSSSELMFP
jgi:hypothetical protein